MGYGDLAATSVAGRAVACLVMVIGVLALALPIAVIGSNFSSLYAELIRENAMKGVENIFNFHSLRDDTITNMFNSFDVHKKGYLTKTDFVSGFRKAGKERFGENFEDVYEAMYEEFDKDDSDSMDLTEFKAMCKKLQNSYLQNRVGTEADELLCNEYGAPKTDGKQSSDVNTDRHSNYEKSKGLPTPSSRGSTSLKDRDTIDIDFTHPTLDKLDRSDAASSHLHTSMTDSHMLSGLQVNTSLVAVAAAATGPRTDHTSLDIVRCTILQLRSELEESTRRAKADIEKRFQEQLQIVDKQHAIVAHKLDEVLKSLC